MSNLLGSIFGFGNKMKRRLRDAVSNPSDYAEMTADENRNEWRKNPDERSLGFFNPVPLGTLGNFTMRKELGDAVANLSRRDFLKKSAGLAGGTAAASIPGAKLLQKFAPEERAIAKETVTEAAPKYKYNSLKEYLDDVDDYIKEGHADDFHSGYDPHSEAFKANPEIELNKAWIDANNMKAERMRERLLRDEATYRTNKQRFEPGGTYDPEKYSLSPSYQKMYDDYMNNQKNAFSPQAKKEMKEFKSLTKQIDTDYTGSHDWTQWAIKNSEDPTKIVEELKKWYIP